MIIRNDDVAFDTSLHEIETFCELCDRYGFQPLHAITPIGAVRHIQSSWDNARIRKESGNRLFLDNEPVVRYLQGRKGDLFAVHGLWHTHDLTGPELSGAYAILSTANYGFPITYIIAPFNEECHGSWKMAADCDGLRDAHECPRIEAYLGNPEAMPESEIVYLHSWRFEHGPFTWKDLESCLSRLSTLRSSSAATPSLTTGA